MSQAAMAPPEGVEADLQSPTDVIHTTNFVTQALTLSFCSAFVFIRALQKFRVPTLNLSVDDCKFPIGNALSHRIITDRSCRSHIGIMDIPGRVLRSWYLQ